MSIFEQLRWLRTATVIFTMALTKCVYTSIQVYVVRDVFWVLVLCVCFHLHLH